jgi:endoglucanase
MLTRIGRGVNFGNALDAPNEGEWGVTLQESYFELAHAAGFASIRLPVRFHAHSTEAAPYTIDPVFFQRVDWAVDNSLRRNMVVILDMHHFVTLMDCVTCERARFISLWRQIAEHYQGFPANLVFELLNEPTDQVPYDTWNSMAAEALAVIRETNPRRVVIIGPVIWNSLGSLPLLELPEADRQIIVTFHYYEPFAFTHQGADWVPGANAWLGKTWSGNLIDQYAINKDFQTVADWGHQHNRPILLGEFGANEKADMDSRARYTAFVTRQAEAMGFAWTYWEFCSNFGVYDPVAEKWRIPILKALLPESPLVPSS